MTALHLHLLSFTIAQSAMFIEDRRSRGKIDLETAAVYGKYVTSQASDHRVFALLFSGEFFVLFFSFH